MGDVTPLLLLLCTAVTVSPAVDLQKRIIQGGPCGNDQHPYHVKFINEYDRFFCGGSLISNQWILTAAHCWQLFMRAVVNVHPGPNHTEIIREPPVICKDNNRIHDIMLLKLPNPIQGAHTVILPNRQECRNKPRVNDQVQIAGFAATQVNTTTGKRGNDRPAQLQCADIPVVNCQAFRNLAQNEFRPFYQANGHHHWICAQSTIVDIALGDSGGGVEYNGRIYGVISATGNGTYPFVQPALFMDVCEYRKWIEKTVGIGILNKIRNAIKKRLR